MMKNLLLFLLLAVSAISFAQVKVGDNPNTIDPFSILELESIDKALVVTRVTDVEMNAITPLNGAIIYNTTNDCLYQFKAGLWESLCISGTMTDNGDGSYLFTNANGGTVTIDTNAVSNPYNNATSGLNAMNVQDAIDELVSSTASVSLVDNLDGTYTFTDASGNTVTIADTTVSTLVDNGNDTYTYTDETGVQTIIDTTVIETITSLGLNASQTALEYTDEAGVITTVDLSTVIQNLETVTTLIDNANGTFTYTAEDGTQTVISVSALETLTSIALNADDTNIDYTDEDGVVTQLDLSAIVANLEALTTIVDNNDGTFTYTDEDGVDTIIDVANLETLTSIALNADDSNIDYTDEDGIVTQLDLSAIVANLEALTTIVDNNDGTFTYTDEDGVDTIIDVANLETLTSIALNADDTNIDYTDEDGVVTQLDLSAIVANLETITTLVDNGDGTFTYTSEDNTVTTFDADGDLVDNADGTFTYTNAAGVPVSFDARIATVVDNMDGTFTITDDFGDSVTIDVNDTLTLLTQATGNTDADVTASDANTIATYTDENGDDFTINETVTTLTFDNTTNELEFTDETGTPNAVDLSSLVHTGTQGSVFFAGADGNPTEDNDEVFWDETNNRFGIGTNTPTNKLQVSGAIRSAGFLNSDGNAGEPAYRFTDDTNTGMYSPAADEIGLTVGGIEAINIDETSGATTVRINETIDLDGPLLDENDSAGTPGQVLTATATGTEWTDTAVETVTTFVQDDTSPTGEITYTDEDGNPSTAQVVSADTDNDIQVGTDGGAFFMSPVKAMGKVNADGSTNKAPLNATVSNIGVGSYQITFANAMPDGDYIIQLTIRDSAGVGNDDYDLSYSAQNANGFVVQVGDNDNGGSDRAPRNFEFMFTVLDY